MDKSITTNTKKLKLTFDISVLTRGYWKNTSRSGIFVVALNILKQLLNNTDIDLTLTCDPFKFYYVMHVLNNEFSEETLNKEIKSKIRVNSLLTLYSKLKHIKRMASEQKNYFKKTLVQILFTVLAPFFQLIRWLQPEDSFSDQDAFLSPALPISTKVKTKKYIILHDLIPLQFPELAFEPWKKGYWTCDVCESLNHNDYYFTISECTRQNFLKYFPQIDPQKIITTLLACNESFKPLNKENSANLIKQIKEKYKIPTNTKYVFSLCSLEPRKNLQRNVKTFIEFIKKNKIEDLIFVLGGGQVETFMNKLNKDIENFGEYKDKILKIGYVDDQDLPILYNGAEWFVYTSIYEGFGLPPLEAMSCGCPVIVSNNSSLPEVVGDAGIQIEWNNDQQHIAAYEQYYYDSDLREKNRRKGIMQSSKFSWEICVNKIIQVMRNNS